MIKFHAHELTRNSFLSAMRKLDGYSGFTDARFAFRVGRLCKDIDGILKKVRIEFFELGRKYAKIAPDTGLPLFEVNSMERHALKDESKKEEYDKLREAIQDHEFSFKILPIPFTEVGAVGLAPGELVSIEKLLEGIPNE